MKASLGSDRVSQSSVFAKQRRLLGIATISLGSPSRSLKVLNASSSHGITDTRKLRLIGMAVRQIHLQDVNNRC
jgi:hypothetical protein